MRKLVLILIALIAAVTFIRSLDGSLKAEEQFADIGAAATAPDLQEK
jgi:hypothetical protein